MNRVFCVDLPDPPFELCVEIAHFFVSIMALLAELAGNKFGRAFKSEKIGLLVCLFVSPLLLQGPHYYIRARES